MQFSGRVTGLLGTIRTVEQQVRYEYKWSHHLISLLFIANIIFYFVIDVMSDESVSQISQSFRGEMAMLLASSRRFSCTLRPAPQTDRQTDSNTVWYDTWWYRVRLGTRRRPFRDIFVHSKFIVVRKNFMNQSQTTYHRRYLRATCIIYHQHQLRNSIIKERNHDGAFPHNTHWW